MRFVFLFLATITFAAANVLAELPAQRANCVASQKSLSAGFLSRIEKLPRPRLMLDIGQSKLEISTKSKNAQNFFNQGLNQLHADWDFEAYRSFREVVRYDAKAAMGYWGMALALSGSLEFSEQRAKLINKALALSSSVSEHEQFYIQALSLREREGRSVYQRTLEVLIAKFPEDVEAKLFLAWDLADGHDEAGNPRSGTQRAKKMLEELLKANPKNFAAHYYYINLLKHGRGRKLIKKNAEKITTLAPNSPHVLHLAGEVAFLLGDYDAAYAAFLSALKIDAEYMQNERVSAEDNWSYMQNLDYLISAAAESGRLREGRRFAELLRDIAPEEGREKSTGTWEMFYNGRLAEARLYWRFGKWKKAAANVQELLVQDKLPSAQVESYYRGLSAYLQGMEAVAKNNLKTAQGLLEDTEMRRWELHRGTSSLTEQFYVETAEQMLAIAADELRGQIYSLNGEHDFAISWLRQAQKKQDALECLEPPAYPRPVLQTLGQAYLRQGNWRQARSIWKGILEARPNNGRVYYGVAKIYQTINSKRKIREYYKKFLDAWRFADADLKSVKEAKAWLEKNGSRNSIFQIFSW